MKIKMTWEEWARALSEEGSDNDPVWYHGKETSAFELGYNSNCRDDCFYNPITYFAGSPIRKINGTCGGMLKDRRRFHGKPSKIEEDGFDSIKQHMDEQQLAVNQELRQRLAVETAFVRDKEADIVRLKKEVESLRAKHEESSNNAKQLGSEATAWKNEVFRLTGIARIKNSTENFETNALRSKVITLQSEVDSLKNLVSSMEKEKSKARESFRSLKIALTKLTEDI